MQRVINLVLAVSFIASVSFVLAQPQTFSYTIPATDVIAVSGGTVSIDLATPAAGSVFATGSSSSTSLAFTSNNASLRNITVSLDSAMPSGTRLLLKPSGGTRTADNLAFTGGVEPTFVNSVTLSTTAQKIVVGSNNLGGFKQVAYSGVALTYELTASLEAAPQTTSDSRTVTFSIIAN